LLTLSVETPVDLLLDETALVTSDRRGASLLLPFPPARDERREVSFS
jgi:hypothetical protein